MNASDVLLNTGAGLPPRAVIPDFGDWMNSGVFERDSIPCNENFLPEPKQRRRLYSLPKPVLDEQGEPVVLGVGSNQAQASWLWRLGLVGKRGKGGKAQRLALCLQIGRVWECPSCRGRWKEGFRCGLRTCPVCAPRNFDELFSRYCQLDDVISPALKCLPGWGWKILDFSFRHDGRMPTSDEVRLHAKVVARVVRRAVAQVMAEILEEGRGCSLVLGTDGEPELREGFPLGRHRSGEVRWLRGWQAIKDRRGRWRLRPGWGYLRCGEFGFDSTNHHYHGAFFGPCIPVKLLSDLFKRESLRLLGTESYRLVIASARRGYGSVLAHALKYTRKIPASTPEGLARMELALDGTRRVQGMGLFFNIRLPEKEKESRTCPDCKVPQELVPVGGYVPISELADLPEMPAAGVEEVPEGDFEEEVFAGRAP